jgi:hypothetical protein
MQRLVHRIMSLVPRQGAEGPQIHLNRIAQGHSYDRALAAFKAEQARRAERNRTAAGEAHPKNGR